VSQQAETATPRARSPLSAVEAKLQAQRIAFGPILFHAVQALNELGLLRCLWEHDQGGLLAAELWEKAGLPRYGVSVLCQAALLGGVLSQDQGGRLRLSKVGYFLLHDSMTRVNFDFVRDVCYSAMPALPQAALRGSPSGLAALGGGNTVYESLMQLPERALQSWLAFDHFYSDQAFSDALALVLEKRPRSLLDVGANTGRFAERCLAADSELDVILLDHPAQLAEAERNLVARGFGARLRLTPMDLLSREELQLPGPVDAVWLSQLLDCLAPDDAVRVLTAARRALAPGGHVFVLEPCCDLQAHEAGSFCLAQTSLYFTCVANGVSRLYDSQTLTDFLQRAGLHLLTRHDHLGVGHSLFVAGVAAPTPSEP
jgi:SAM-dependent methyltransferase